MKQVRVFKSDESREVIRHWYQKFTDVLPFPLREQTVQTRFGRTQVAQTGPTDQDTDDQPPIVILHGAMSGAPFALGELCDLPARRRMVAINIHGQSPMADPVRLNFKTNEYAVWLDEVFNQLDLPRVVLAGVSWGGSVALQMAKHKPERIAGMILVVPGSVVRGSAWRGLIDVGLPMLRFRCWPTDANRDKALNKVFTSHDPLWTPYLADALAHYRTDFQMPPLIKPSDMAGLQSPVYVFAADKDVFFPGRALLNQAKRLFPNLVGTHLLADSYHSPSFTPEARRTFTKAFEQAITLVSSRQCVSPTETPS